ncbi:hypothetical protein SAMN04490202_5676 [Pseudomonas reinekei]|uniref:Uncharacterized protein n=1 Tax=Pseudomonas reinekei TaxID=395598 RepID=A0A1H0UVE9_PSERE|nr:hypothetical protein [Pseudomonas reinekei]KAB0488506.1 hypothetical protein F7R15_01175 [Pseudomonas reinekei]OLU05999.1 hypothetical protein BVK86_01170 [Pseudomonas reinekei]SDP70184.1 hypothetical protein SAMN04490202_5676 [Pseudomonas reinekei]
MASNSLASILEKMKDRAITERWGAVCAFDRERLNRVLLQQWLEKYDGSNYVPVFSGEVHLNDSLTEKGVLKDVMIGKPLLSFEPAALDNSRAILTFSILGGSFTAFEIKTGVLYSYQITEAQGYTLKIKLDLSLVVGSIDRLGRVTLDLSKGTEFVCDLAAPVASQQKIGGFFQEKFNNLPVERQVYELGILDLKGGSDLSPTNFIILTQRAPGAQLPGALNVGDGAVVVLIKLRGNATGGDIPSRDRFPYLIPDDEENGVRKYSATMVLAKEFIERSDDEKLDLIRSVLFPGQKNVFVEHSRHTPHDMVIFGSLDPSRTSLTIEPAMHSLKAGGSPLTYKALFNGAPVSGVTWSVRSLNTIESAGSINATTGVYQPVTAAKLGKESVRNIVTATWTQPANGDIPARVHRVSALLLVTAEAMTLSPGCVPRQVGGPSVTFVATALSGSALTWSQPAYGRLVANGNSAVYTPPSNADDLPEHLMVQPIEVRDASGETVRACVVLSKFPTTMTIEPAFVSSIARSATVKLEPVTDAPPEFERSWEVLGDGTVRDGVFTAPTITSRPFSVVKCDISYMGIIVRTGYSIIKLNNIDVESDWTMLTKFSLTALRSPKVYANGYQQLAVEVRIETDGRPLTPEEEDTMMIYHRRSEQQVAEVAAGQEGIPYDPLAPLLWAQTRIPNRFRSFVSNGQNEATGVSTTATPNLITVYLVTRDVQVGDFYAVVDDPSGQAPFRSDAHPGHEDGTIKLEPVPSPEVHPDSFKMTRRRVKGGGPDDPENGENDDGFELFLETTDYFTLTYKKGGQQGGMPLNFEAVEFQSPFGVGISPVTTSMVKWESPYDNEKMFTYTGYAFNDPRVAGDEGVMAFDSIIKANRNLKPVLDQNLDRPIAAGAFLIGVFRRIDIRQADSNGTSGNPDLYPLKEGLKVVLTDTEGHRHPVRISFPTNNRNRPVVEPLFEH